MSFSATYRGPGVDGEVHVGGMHNEEAGRRCAIGFNPSGHAPTALIKGFCAAAMQSVIEAREVMRREFDSRDSTAAESVGFNDAMRCYATALTHLEAAQMFAVKGLHAVKNAGAG